jgi:hypothetical protein
VRWTDSRRSVLGAAFGGGACFTFSAAVVMMTYNRRSVLGAACGGGAL